MSRPVRLALLTKGDIGWISYKTVSQTYMSWPYGSFCSPVGYISLFA